MKIRRTTTATNYEELNNIQSKLMHHIEKTPGVRYNELARLVTLSNGVLTYHLSLLEKANHITVDRNEKSRSYSILCCRYSYRRNKNCWLY